MISIVIPVYNEEESLKELFKEIDNALQKLKLEYEIIFVDDGSVDNSLEIIQNRAKKDIHIRIFSFRKNQGKAEAFTLGFQKAKGEYIITLDADLQDKPSEISNLLSEIRKNNADVVCGWRKHRKDPFAKVLSSKLFNFIARSFWGLDLHDYNCGLKVFTKEAAQSVNLYGGMHRFIPLLMYQRGFRVSEVAVSHDKRRYGISKYGFSKLWNDLPDIFTMLFLSRYSQRPLHFFGFIGFLFLFIGMAILAYLTVIHFQGHAIGERPLLFFGGLLVLGGLQITFTGFLADLLINQSQNNKASLLRYSSE